MLFLRNLKVNSVFRVGTLQYPIKRCYTTLVKTHLQDIPTKDRFPPAAYDPHNPKRRLAVLIDGSKVDADSFCRTIEPVVHKFGIPILFRMFDTDLRPDWITLVEPNLGRDIINPFVQRKFPGPEIEWFRVDRFIPVSMQLGADAVHIFDFRNSNKIEGICYVCSATEKEIFERYLPRFQGKRYSQFVIDDIGGVSSLIEDGRSLDGIS